MIQFSVQKNLQTTEGEKLLQVHAGIETGRLVSLYGPSGAGKTSVLRMLAGLLAPDAGHIKVNGALWLDSNKKIILPPQQRRTGFVFQDYALFPNMNVRENIAFALTRGASKEIVEELLELTGLTGLAKRRIQTLSGGQQQRVALARAIAGKPQLLLLDEPLAAIDRDMRRQLQDTLLLLHRRFGLTTLLVSHDIEEIIRLSDQIIHLQRDKAVTYDNSEAFLKGIGYKHELTGTVLARNDNQVSVFLQPSLVEMPIAGPGSMQLNKGDRVAVVYHDDQTPRLQTIK